jgi:hypothetical protein
MKLYIKPMRRRAFALLAAASLLVVTGCDSNKGDEEDDLTTEVAALTADLSEPHGGLTSGEESADFGDSEVAELDLATEDPAASDSFATDPAVTTAEAADDTDVYMALIAWGNVLRGADAPTTVWDGKVTTNAGSLVVVRAVRFEDATDSLDARATVTEAGFKSTTKGGVDGLVVKLIVTADDKATLGTDKLQVTFETGPLTKTVDVKEAAWRAGAMVDGSETLGAAYLGFKLSKTGCNQGFLAGRWHTLVDGTAGRLRGRWIDHTGAHAGLLKGLYGKREDGKKVFFGKAIDKVGGFSGFHEGEYADGTFNGSWVSADGTTTGSLEGRYQGAKKLDRKGGFFAGTWEKDCP